MPVTVSPIAAIPPLLVVGDQVRPLVQSAAFECFEMIGPLDSGPPPHAHPWDENYVVLEGSLEVHGPEGAVVVGPGEVVRIPGGTLHHYRIATAGTRFLVLTSGDAAGRFFADIDRSLPPGPPTPDSMPALIEVARRNSLSSPLFQ